MRTWKLLPADLPEGAPPPTPVPSMPGYHVTADGQVFSARRPRMLRRRLQTNGRYLWIIAKVNGARRLAFVHGMVCEAFHGPRPPGHQVRHLDNNGFNNHESNLAWGTAKENMADKKVHGTDSVGSKNPRALITEDDVDTIRARVAAGETRTAVAADYGMVLITVDQIVSGATWKHVSMPDMSHSVTRHGERNINAKLNPAKVHEIRSAVRGGASMRSVARRFGVAGTTISAIICGETWKHVPCVASDAIVLSRGAT